MATTSVGNPEKLPQLTRQFWLKISQRIGGIGGWVYLDCEKGLMQNNTQKHQLSKQYKKYKDHDMKRFSDDKRLGSSRKLVDGTTKTYKTRKYPLCRAVPLWCHL